MIESRAGAESGVKEVQFLSGESLWKAAEEKLWSIDLADAALRAELGGETPTLTELVKKEAFANPHGILVTYRDGFRIVLKVGNSGTRWNFACQLAGEKSPRATSFYVGPWQNRNLFKALSHAVQIFLREKSPYPIERTLLTTGILAAEMDSHFDKGRPIETPWLDIAYKPVDFRRCREMGETWKKSPMRRLSPWGFITTSNKSVPNGESVQDDRSRRW